MNFLTNKDDSLAYTRQSRKPLLTQISHNVHNAVPIMNSLSKKFKDLKDVNFKRYTSNSVFLVGDIFNKQVVNILCGLVYVIGKFVNKLDKIFVVSCFFYFQKRVMRSFAVSRRR